MNTTNLNNPNNDVYWQARGYEKRPKNWKKLLNSKASKRKQNREAYDLGWSDRGDCPFPLSKDDY